MITFSLVGLFGEGPQDRRERLRSLISQMGEQIFKKKKAQEEAEKRKRDVSQKITCLVIFLHYCTVSLSITHLVW